MFVGDHQVQILVCCEPVDMRKGYNGLSGLIRDTLKEEPLSGKLFVFQGRRRDSVKIIYWHHNGFAIWSKRLQKGMFKFPPSKSGSMQMTRSALRMILEGIDLASLHQKSA